MGNLCLTRRAGESVQLVEADGSRWLLTVRQLQLNCGVRVAIVKERGNQDSRWMFPGESWTFAGGTVELRPARGKGQAILSFDFPPEVKILRSELL